MRLLRRGVLPGFKLSLGFTAVYVALMVILPLSVLFWRAGSLHWGELLEVIGDRRSLAAFRLSFSVSLLAALVNLLFGGVLAWVLTRYEFPGRGLLDALVDLPFALPTAVSGIALTSIYAEKGLFGQYLQLASLKVAFTWLGVLVALIFVGIPFVVRTLQPVLEELDADLEEAAAVLGAGPLETFVRVIFPALIPALLTGFALSFARALGEYGSVVFISGNMPYKTEIVPLLIVTKLEQFDYGGATALGAVMLVAAFAILLGVNALERWSRRAEA
jgi:sulfate transport system permease protein